MKNICNIFTKRYFFVFLVSFDSNAIYVLFLKTRIYDHEKKNYSSPIKSIFCHKRPQKPYNTVRTIQRSYKIRIGQKKTILSRARPHIFICKHFLFDWKQPFSRTCFVPFGTFSAHVSMPTTTTTTNFL